MSPRQWERHRLSAYFEGLPFEDQLEILHASRWPLLRRRAVMDRMMRDLHSEQEQRRGARRREVLRYVRDVSTEVLGGVILLGVAAMLAAGFWNIIPWLLIAKIAVIVVICLVTASVGVTLFIIMVFAEGAMADDAASSGEQKAKRRDPLTRWLIVLTVLVGLALVAVVIVFFPA